MPIIIILLVLIIILLVTNIRVVPQATEFVIERLGTYYTTSKALLDTGFYLLGMMEEDSAKLAARDLHELLRCWENYHRLWTVRLHMQHIAFREESRYPGFYYRADFLGIDASRWKCFVNSKYDPATGETKIFKKPYYQIIPD